MPAIDLGHRHVRRYRPFHVEQRRAERGRHERGLQVHGDEGREPGHEIAGAAEMIAEVEPRQDGNEDRQHDQADLQPLEREAE